MSKAHKQNYHRVIFLIKSDQRQSTHTLLSNVRSRHRPGMWKAGVGWLFSSRGAQTPGERTGSVNDGCVPIKKTFQGG